MSGLSENTSGIDNYVNLRDHYKEPKARLRTGPED